MKITRPVALAEFLGTAGLLIVVVGSGFAVERLGAAPATQLFVHAIVVALGLASLIFVFMPVSGSQFNPIVTLALLRRGRLGRRQAAEISVAQLGGAVFGVVVANAMFAGTAVAVSSTDRAGMAVLVGELVASFGLVLVVLTIAETGRHAGMGPAVGAWVGAMIVASSSTGFANPAVAVSRTLTDSYTGIAPGSVPAFVIVQVVGGLAAVWVASALLEDREVVNV